MDLPTERRREHAPAFEPLSPRPIVLTAAVLAVMASRLLPHPPNFAPVGACALFGGACFAGPRAAFAVPLASMMLSDLLIGFSVLSPVVYACLLLQVALGMWIRPRRRAASIAGAVFLGACIFFVVTNAACWLAFYPKTPAGLARCYASAIPFFGWSLLGDVTFASLLFGGLAVAEGRFPALRESAIPIAA